MKKMNKHYCPSRDKFVSVAGGFEKCIRDNQCFSDDPCPLFDEFNRPSEMASNTQKLHAVKARFKK